jgi:large subunit ribosomal protein L25
MRISFTFGADLRDAQGKGASRRLRHQGKVPAILYGGHQDAQTLVLDQQNLLTMVGDERFYSSIVQLKIGERTQEAIVKDIQMHPAKNVVVHVDLQRVVENEKIRIMLPIHFKNETVSPGVKVQGGVVSHMRSDVEVTCLPKDLPEFLEVDLSAMEINDIKRLSDIPLPAGVQLVDLAHGRDEAVASIHHPRAEEVEAAPAEAAAAVAGATPVAGAAAPAAAGAPAAGGDAKKEEGKPAAAAAGAPKAAAAPKKEGGKK